MGRFARLLAAASPLLPAAAAAQAFVRAVPLTAVPLAPVFAPVPSPAASLPSLSAPSLLAPLPPSALPAPAAAPAATPAAAAALPQAAVAAHELTPEPGPEDLAAAGARLNAFFDGAGTRAASAEVQDLLDALVTGRASPAFVAQLRGHMARTIPPAVLHELVRGGYRVHVDAAIRQGRRELDQDNDYTGGFHSYGPEGRFIVIAERIKHKKSGQWRPNRVWENGIDHEIGHAVAYLLGEMAAAASAAEGKAEQAEWLRTKGLSEHPDFREAWRKDFEAMPPEALAAMKADGTANDFYYFVHPDPNGWFQRARQETWAEGFDILLRGERSRFNHDNFARWFPRSMAVLHRLLEEAYGAGFGAGD